MHRLMHPDRSSPIQAVPAGSILEMEPAPGPVPGHIPGLVLQLISRCCKSCIQGGAVPAGSILEPGPVLDHLPEHVPGLVLPLVTHSCTGPQTKCRSFLHLALVLLHHLRHFAFLAADAVLEHLFLPVIL